MGYTIVTGDDAYVSRRVCELLEDGWLPVGGVAMTVETWEDGKGDHSQTVYAQAMIKQDKPEQDEAI